LSWRVNTELTKKYADNAESQTQSMRSNVENAGVRILDSREQKEEEDKTASYLVTQ
jgi:hypothetical protein